jgi:hypothetical protein
LRREGQRHEKPGGHPENGVKRAAIYFVRPEHRLRIGESRINFCLKKPQPAVGNWKFEKQHLISVSLGAKFVALASIWPKTRHLPTHRGKSNPTLLKFMALRKVLAMRKHGSQSNLTTASFFKDLIRF